MKRTCQVGIILVCSLFILRSCDNVEQRKISIAKGPNIILVNTDDLGAYSLGAYGQEVIQTPFLDSMATSGVLFTRGYSPAHICGPSRISLLVSKHVGHLRNRTNGANCKVEKDEICFPEILQENGYKTAMFGKHHNASFFNGRPISDLPGDNGFDQFVGTLSAMAAHQFYLDGKTAPHMNYPKHLWQEKKGQISKYHINPERYTHNEYMDLTYDFLKEDHDKPFFLYLALQIPHYELVVPEKGDMDYHPEDEGLLEQYLDENNESVFQESPHKKSTYFQRPVPTPAATYAAMISRLDRDMGKMLRLLESRGMKKNTIVIFTSDNGFAGIGGEDPFVHGTYARANKGSLYEGGLRVPYIFWGQNIQKNKIVEQSIVGYDLGPTVLDLAGIQSNFTSDGISFKDALLTEEIVTRDFIYWENYLGGPCQALILSDRYKVLRINCKDPKVELEVYDLINDPLEKDNLIHSPQMTEIIERALLLFGREHNATSEYNLSFDRSTFTL